MSEWPRTEEYINWPKKWSADEIAWAKREIIGEYLRDQRSAEARSERVDTNRQPEDDAECERLGCGDRTHPVFHPAAPMNTNEAAERLRQVCGKTEQAQRAGGSVEVYVCWREPDHEDSHHGPLMGRAPGPDEAFMTWPLAPHRSGYENGKPVPTRPNPVVHESYEPPLGCASWVLAIWTFVAGLIIGMNWL